MCGGRGRAQEAAMGFLKLSDIEPLIDVRGFDRWVFVVDPGNSTSTCHLTAQAPVTLQQPDFIHFIPVSYTHLTLPTKA